MFENIVWLEGEALPCSAQSPIILQSFGRAKRSFRVIFDVILTHWGLVTPYGVMIDTGKGMLLTVPSHYLNDVDLSLVGPFAKHLKGTSNGNARENNHSILRIRKLHIWN